MEQETKQPEKKDNVFKRMGRGFKVMHEKIYSTQLVKNIQEQNEAQNNNSISPIGFGAVEEDSFSTDFDNIGIKQNKKKKKKQKEYNPFATDFSELNVGL